MNRTALRAAIMTAIREYAGDNPEHELGTVAHKCSREINAVIARADYFISLRPDPAEIAAERSDDPRPWPALVMAQDAAAKDPA